METRYYLAVDIGASSGRHMLSHMESGEMIIEEIYRFPNGMIEKKGPSITVIPVDFNFSDGSQRIISQSSYLILNLSVWIFLILSKI